MLITQQRCDNNQFLKIKRIDKAVAWYEAIAIGGYTEKEAKQIIKYPDLTLSNRKIIPLSPNSTAEKFLKKFTMTIKLKV